MRTLLRSMVFILVPGLFNLAHAGIVTFDFEADGGSATPFTSTVGSLSAMFSSPGVYSVLPASGLPFQFQTLTGNILLGDGSNLTIVFSAPQTSIDLNFGEALGVSLDLTAFLGGTGGAQVGTSSATGGMPPGTQLPEGVLSFNGGTFDTIVLSSTTTFAIDNVAVNAAASAVPEPGSFLLCGGVLAALSFVQLRRRRA